MKIKVIAASMMGLAMLASCSTGSKQLSDKSTATDSLSYTMGEIAGVQRAMSFQQDTLLKSEAARKAFDEGFAKGFAMLKDGDEGYNSGLLLGLQMAMQMQDMKKNNDIALDPALVLGGFNAMKADTTAGDMNAFQKIQERGMRLMTSIMADRVKVKVDAHAKKAGFKQQQGVYLTQTKAGNGAAVAMGDSVRVRLNIKDTQGRELIPQLKDQEMPYAVGAGQLPVLDKVLPMMTEGQVYEVLASPQQAFGAQTPPMVDAKEPVIITIEVVGKGAAAPAAPAAEPATAK